MNPKSKRAVVVCSKKHGLNIKVRSGGHDFEGLSSTSNVPFVLVDLINLIAIDVDIKHNSAWVQAGATLGEVYYRWRQLRSHGEKIRNGCKFVLDARLFNAKGETLNRETMGEDLFWAIREQGATELVHKWQSVASYRVPKEAFTGLHVGVVNKCSNNATKGGAERTVQATFRVLFLGPAETLMNEWKRDFPELGMERKDCKEMSWVESTVRFAWFPSGTLEKKGPKPQKSTEVGSNDCMTPYVSKSPRTAFLDYKDLDLGQIGASTHTDAKIWGELYFKCNFKKLVNVKSKVDPDNFRGEQNIPPAITN
ncbi:hypothetical protein Syun_007284 [Stephania yunnanensis]|uniref:FAD-binding PCMH-type domain-containing protein n=1 Tax=Stephania yunnanensis TaxID=152371 RepID=A0AAP0PYJ3_9MAGN